MGRLGLGAAGVWSQLRELRDGPGLSKPRFPLRMTLLDSNLRGFSDSHVL